MKIIGAEVLTAVLYLYLGLALPGFSWHTIGGTLRALHFIGVIVAAALTVVALVRRRPWAAKAVVVLAAYVGLPNLAVIGGILQSIPAHAPPAVVLSWSFVLGATVAQLVAFLLALRQLRVGQAAA